MLGPGAPGGYNERPELHDILYRQISTEDVAYIMNRLSILFGIWGSLALAGSVSAAGKTPADLTTPVISEFLASNGSEEPLGEGDLLDADGDSSDWIELYNPTARTFDLGGWSLTDNPGKLAKWRFPSPTLLVPGGYLLVFASGKNRTAGELHTNFKLAAEGGYLALVLPDGRTVAHAYGPAYPPQRRDVSYGLPDQPVSLGTPQYFPIPTPGRPNVSDSVDVVAGPRFSHEHGLYDDPFTLTLSCDTPGATIRYTTDGKPPMETGGQVYTAGIVIQATTCVRAAAFKVGCLPSPVHTRTFIFPADVERQPGRPPGFPAAWDSAVADYEMDPEIVDSLAPRQLAQALQSLPTMSIVMDVNELFGATGLYPNWKYSGDSWERPCSVELIPSDGTAGFQVDCGLRIYGGVGRREAKKSFRLQFTSAYGPSELRYPLFGAGAADRFDQLILRASYNDAYGYSWTGDHAQYLRDEFVRRLQLALGNPASHGTFVHLYLNGLYWGLYNPVERPESSFAATYFGGDKSDWDALNAGQPVGAGTTATWNAMLSLVRQGMASNVNYQRLQGNHPDGTRNPQYPDYLDLDNYIDYLLVNFFAGNKDWPGQNWYAAMNRVESSGWKSFSWDAEWVMGIKSPLTVNIADVNTGICEPYAALRANPEFCLRFADRAYRAFFNGGPLYVDPSPSPWDRDPSERNRPAALYAELADGIEPAIVGESARWGDARGAGPYRIDQWRNERDWILNTYLAQRSGIVFDQLRSAGLYPTLDPPTFQISSDLVTMTAPTGAAIYYTTDGSDPRTPAFLSGDEKTITLVPEEAPKRVLVPSVANGGNLLPNFTAGFKVTCYMAKDAVDSLAAAEAVIANPALRTSTVEEQARVINYGNAGGAGHFEADRPFPGATFDADPEDFVVLVTGKVTIPHAGDWTFGVRSSDGFRLSLSRRGAAYTCSYPGPRPADDTLAVFNIAQAGPHDLRLVYYHGRGSAELELGAAPGSFPVFSAPEFHLVGDILTGSAPGEQDTLWFANSFDDSAWRLGTGVVGFARDASGPTLFPIEVGAEMYKINGSCYIRIPFMAATTSFAGLMLRVRYDDGFIAYLNGTEVARRNFSGDPQWNSVARSVNAENTAVTPVTLDISDHVGLLKPGANLLALHGLNASADSPEFLIAAELTAGEWGPGAVSPTATLYVDPITLDQSTRVRARAFNGRWSALHEAVLAVGPVTEGLRISELMYHPPDTGDPDDPNTEFIELTNIAGQSLNLNLVRFTEGIDFVFPSFVLAPGGYCLVVKDVAAFQAKYGAKLPVVGRYGGSLDNGGERLELVDAAGRMIESFTYSDWFESTDGRGFSLTVKDPKTTDPNRLNEAGAWRPSLSLGGSPGTGDSG
jgi:hypothetical protein